VDAFGNERGGGGGGCGGVAAVESGDICSEASGEPSGGEAALAEAEDGDALTAIFSGGGDHGEGFSGV
jgi:hypothetical protein